MQKKYQCYSAGPGLFPRDLPNGGREDWEEAQKRVCKLNETISNNPLFDVITPSNESLVNWPEHDRARVCMLTDMLYATRSDIVFADLTPFGGREPDSGTVVEAVACALSGGLLVLWSDPLTTFAERYRDADVHPDTELDEYYNLMIEQLYQYSWEVHFGFSRPVFDSLESAVEETAIQIENHGFERTNLLQKFDDTRAIAVVSAVERLLYTV